MARRRYVFTPRRRAALRKAQLKSARKRKGSGRKSKIVKTVAIGGAAVAVGTAVYKGKQGIKDNALKKKHGDDYIPRKGKYSHYTNNNAARRIAKTKKFKTVGTNSAAKYHTNNAVWLTHHRKTGHYDGAVRDHLGKAKVTVKLKRKDVLKNHRQTNRNGFKTGNGILHVQIDQAAFKGKRIKHNLPKTAKGVRRRQASHVRSGMSHWEAGLNQAVHPSRRRIKKSVKKRKRKKR